MRFSIRMVGISLLFFSFSRIFSACLEESSPVALKDAMTVKDGKSGWWCQEADAILQKYVFDRGQLVSELESTMVPGLFNRQLYDQYVEKTKILFEAFKAAIPQYFSKPIEEALKTIEPCCVVDDSQGKYVPAICGIPIFSITSNLAEFEPTMEFCKKMRLDADKEFFPTFLYYFFKKLNIDPNKADELSTLERVKNLYASGENGLARDKVCDRKKALFETLLRLTSSYKIHFMPCDNDLLSFIAILFSEIRNYPALRNALRAIKIIPIPERVHEIDLKSSFVADRPLNQFPKVILYCFGRRETQEALNILYKIFAGFPGIGRAPAFNEKVTDLIYFAQGDRQDKTLYPEWFDETSNMVYYDKKAIDYVAGCKMSDRYALINPNNHHES